MAFWTYDYRSSAALAVRTDMLRATPVTTGLPVLHCSHSNPSPWGALFTHLLSCPSWCPAPEAGEPAAGRSSAPANLVSWGQWWYQPWNSASSVWVLLKQLTYLLPRHDETVHALNTHYEWHQADHQSQSYKSCSLIVSFYRELLIQSCPAPELPPTHQLLAMVRDGVSGPWIIGWGSVQSFQTIISALCGDNGCTLISLRCQNGIVVVMTISVHCVPLVQVKERAHRSSLGYQNSYIYLSAALSRMSQNDITLENIPALVCMMLLLIFLYK